MQEIKRQRKDETGLDQFDIILDYLRRAPVGGSCIGAPRSITNMPTTKLSFVCFLSLTVPAAGISYIILWNILNPSMIIVSRQVSAFSALSFTITSAPNGTVLSSTLQFAPHMFPLKENVNLSPVIPSVLTGRLISGKVSATSVTTSMTSMVVGGSYAAAALPDIPERDGLTQSYIAQRSVPNDVIMGATMGINMVAGSDTQLKLVPIGVGVQRPKIEEKPISLDTSYSVQYLVSALVPFPAITPPQCECVPVCGMFFSISGSFNVPLTNGTMTVPVANVPLPTLSIADAYDLNLTFSFDATNGFNQYYGRILVADIYSNIDNTSGNVFAVNADGSSGISAVATGNTFSVNSQAYRVVLPSKQPVGNNCCWEGKLVLFAMEAPPGVFPTASSGLFSANLESLSLLQPTGVVDTVAWRIARLDNLGVNQSVVVSGSQEYETTVRDNVQPYAQNLRIPVIPAAVYEAFTEWTAGFSSVPIPIRGSRNYTHETMERLESACGALTKDRVKEWYRSVFALRFQKMEGYAQGKLTHIRQVVQRFRTRLLGVCPPTEIGEKLKLQVECSIIFLDHLCETHIINTSGAYSRTRFSLYDLFFLKTSFQAIQKSWRLILDDGKDLFGAAEREREFVKFLVAELGTLINAVNWNGYGSW